MSKETNQNFLTELEPKVGELFNRHLETSKEWFPHQFVPYGEGHNFGPDEEWDPEQFPLDDATRSSLFVNLLTEDNLPHYFHTIDNMFNEADLDNPWSAWNRRWTAEEGRHSIAIREYAVITGALDPVRLERARMAQVSKGKVPKPKSVADVIVYVALQELATRIAHHNTGAKLKEQGHEAGYEVMKRVGQDENYHHLFYRDLGSAAIQLDPSAMIMAVGRQVRDFEMPGTGIVGFKEHAKAIAQAGIYDIAIHLDKILVPVIQRQWKIETLEGLTPEADTAREGLFNYMERLAKVSKRLTERRSGSEAAQTT